MYKITKIPLKPLKNYQYPTKNYFKKKTTTTITIEMTKVSLEISKITKYLENAYNTL